MSAIADFEKKHSIKISPEVLISQPMGLEGECQIYFLLKGFGRTNIEISFRRELLSRQ